MPELRGHGTGPLPLIVGVTGHRDIPRDDQPALIKGVGGAFGELQGPGSPTPLVVLSSLAPGAPQLAARVAADLGAALIAVLPLPRALYASDFVDEGAADGFARLCDRAHTHVVELPVLPGFSLEAVKRPGPERAEQYATANAWIVRNSQLLVALTDGGPPRGPASSARAVRWQLRGLPRRFAPMRSRIDAAAAGPVWRVVARRSDGDMAANLVGQLRKRYPKRLFRTKRPEPPGLAAQREQDIREQFDEYNRDVLEFRESPRRHAAERVLESRSALLGEDGERLRGYGAALLDRFCETDALAQAFQRRVARVARVLFGSALAGSFMFTLFAEWRWPGLLLGYVAAFLLAVFVYWLFFLRRDWERKRLDYRALAEGLRVQIFWHVAGIPERPSDYYLRLQRNDLDWIREALSVWHLSPSPDTPRTGAWPSETRQDPGEPGWPEIVARRWIDAQREYFSKRFDQNRRLHEWARHLTATLIAAGLLAAAALCCAFIPVRASEASASPTGGAWQYLITGAAIAAAAVRGLVERSKYLGRPRPAREIGPLAAKALGVMAGAGTVILGALSLADESGWAGQALVRFASLAVVIGLAFGRPGPVATASRHRHTLASLAGWIGPPLLDAGILLGVLLPLVRGATHERLVEVLIVESTMLIVLAGVLRAYAEVRAYESEARRYEAMAETFATAGHAFGRLWRHGATAPEDKARRLLMDLGRDALVEHGEWLLIHRDRPFGVVTAG